MKITYDPQVDAIYMSFTDSKVVDCSEEYDGIIFDYNNVDKVVGIEILSVSKLFPELLKGLAQNVPRV